MSRENVEIVRSGWEHFLATGEQPQEIIAPDFSRPCSEKAPDFRAFSETGARLVLLRDAPLTHEYALAS
jgi:hypothetical protein